MPLRIHSFLRTTLHSLRTRTFQLYPRVLALGFDLSCNISVSDRVRLHNPFALTSLDGPGSVLAENKCEAASYAALLGSLVPASPVFLVLLALHLDDNGKSL